MSHEKDQKYNIFVNPKTPINNQIEYIEQLIVAESALSKDERTPISLTALNMATGHLVTLIEIVKRKHTDLQYITVVDQTQQDNDGDSDSTTSKTKTVYALRIDIIV